MDLSSFSTFAIFKFENISRSTFVRSKFQLPPKNSNLKKSPQCVGSIHTVTNTEDGRFFKT